MTTIKKYWLFALLGTLAASAYPLYMGFSVLYDMAVQGTVSEENFPKYIIPYTPIAIAVITAVFLMPLLLKISERACVFIATALSLGVFFVSELLFESKVIVTSTVVTFATLESWQMFMCYIPPESYATRTWTAIDVLIGDYSPIFKLHFYLISAVLIIAMINCLYGFARIIQTNDRTQGRSLIIQSVCTALFLGLCILACFTAFFRDGEITISPLSAVLMGVFFILLGVTAGTYTGSFLLGRKKAVSVWIPSAVALLTTLAMYIGEMFLLSGHIYRFGTGILFDGIPGIVLAPIDLLILLISGCFTAVICCFINQKASKKDVK